MKKLKSNLLRKRKLSLQKSLPQSPPKNLHLNLMQRRKTNLMILPYWIRLKNLKRKKQK